MIIAPMLKLIQKRLLICSCVISLYWIVASDRPKSLNIPAKPVKAVTMLIKPNCSGKSRRAITAIETVCKKNEMTSPVMTPVMTAHDAVMTDPLVAQANVLIDAFAVVLERALTMYGGKVKPDEVRAIFLTAAINYAKDGARR